MADTTETTGPQLVWMLEVPCCAQCVTTVAHSCNDGFITHSVFGTKDAAHAAKRRYDRVSHIHSRVMPRLIQY